MGKIINQFKLLLATVLASFLMVFPCFAAESSITLKTDKTDLKAGEEITVTVDFPEETKIYALTATLQYDQNVFELIDANNFSIPNTAALSYNGDNNQFGIINQTGAVEDDLLVVHLRVKEDGNVGDTNIALTNISSSDGSNSTKYDTVSTKVLVTRDANEGETVPANAENTIIENESEPQSVFYSTPFIITAIIAVAVIALFIVFYHSQINPHTSKLYYALAALGIVIVALVVGIMAINNGKKDVNNDGVVGYDDAQSIIDYLIDLRGNDTTDDTTTSDSSSSTNNSGSQPNSSANNTTKTSTTSLSRSTISFNSNTNSNSSSSSSSNNPGTSTQQPSTPSSPQKPQDFDTNNDGKVDIDDAGHNTEEAQKNTTVELSNLDNSDAYYVEKGNETAQFVAQISPAEVTIKRVKVGDRYYDVEPSETSHNVFYFNVDPMFEAGKWEYPISEVETSNGKTLAVNHILKYEVLKARPEVINFSLDSENHKISFQIDDIDQAFQNGKVSIYHEDDLETAILTQDFSTTDTTEIQSDELAAERATYYIEIVGNYCQVEDTNDTAHCTGDAPLFSHKFTMTDNYDFQLSNYSLTDYVEPGNHPVINFNISNSKNLSVNSVRVLIDGAEIEFPVTLSGDGSFQSILEHAKMEPGQRHKVELSSVMLSDGMVFTNPHDFSATELTYFVPKDVPTVSNLTLSDEKTASQIIAKFDLSDLNQAVSQLAIVMIDAGENIAAKTTLSKEDIGGQTSITAPLDYSSARDKAFTVQVLGDYDLGDKYNFSQVNMAEGEIAIYEEGKMYIDQDLMTTADQISNNNTVKISRYAEKGQKNFGLAFKFFKAQDYTLSNCGPYTTPSSYTVNGNNYPSFGSAKKLQDLGYNTSIILGVPEKAGVVKLSISRAQFIYNKYYHQCSDWYSIPRVSYEFEVLRDMPQIENLRAIHEDYANQTVTFEFDVTVDPDAVEGDESFTSGILKFGDQEAPFSNRGHNSVTFSNIPLDKNQTLDFKATFDRDSDTLNVDGQDENQFNDYSILQTTYGLFNPETYQNVKIEEGEALTNYKEKNDNLFEKNSEIGLYFKLTGLPENAGAPVAATVDDHGGSTYELVQVVDAEGNNLPNYYAIFAAGYPEAGARSLAITNIILDNGKIIPINDPSPIAFEILKDVPTISDLSYKKSGGEIKLHSALNDPNNALLGTPLVIVTDEDSKEVFRGDYAPDLSINDNGNLHYSIKITGSYDRTSAHASNPASDNYFENATLLDSIISLSDNKIELKDITDVSLYHVSNGKSELVDEISKSAINQDPTSYFVQITMNNLSTMFMEVENAEEGADGHLYLVLNSSSLSLEPESISSRIGFDRKVRLDFGAPIDNSGTFANKYHRDTSAEDKASFEELLSKLQNNNDVTLDQDYDASSVATPDNGYYISNFTGNLNGAGHTIKNLKGALFNVLNGRIENLYLENVTVEKNGKGTVAHTANKSTVERVFVKGATLKEGRDQSGGLIGTVDQATTINECAVTDLTLNPGGVQQVGGIAGVIRNGSTIKNTYAEGQISGPSGYLGGIVGSSNVGSSTVENSYAKVRLNSGNPACGVGCIYTGRISFLNTISLSPTYTHPITNEEAKSDQFDNNYYLAVNGKNVAERTGQTVIEDAADVNQQLFKKANFDSKVWRLNNSVSYDNLPALSAEKVDQNAFENQPNYNEVRINTYHNIQKLTPFYETAEIIKEGNRINNTDLSDKSIQAIAPVDANGNLVSYLTTDNPAKISQLKIIFSDGSHGSYTAQYDKTYDMVATYRIPELHLDYNFPHYVIDANARIVDNLTYYLKGLNYTSNLDNLTAAKEGRTLRDFYDETTVNELKDFVLKYLSSTNYTPASNNDAINAHLERVVKQDQKIEKALYAYNYFRRLYNVEVDGLKLYDYVLFGMENLSGDLNTENIINMLFSDSASDKSTVFNTASTNNTYSTIFAKYTGKTNLPSFLEFVVQGFGHGQSMSEWVRSQFKGFLAERSIDSREDYNSDTGVIKQADATSNTNTYYTLWDHFSHSHLGDDNSYRVYNFILPILTLPKDSTYIISSPVQFIIGSQRTYIQYRSTPGAQEAFNFRVKAYANRMKTYFKTAYGLLQDTDRFNNIHIFQIDKTLAYDSDDNGLQVSQRAGSTNDPHFRNFNEVVNLYPADQSVNAASWGPYIEFQVAGVMDATIQEVADYLNIQPNESTFGTWSHETAHSIDSLVWMRGNGRRWKSGGEDYADGNLRQEFNDNLIVMNVTKDWGENCGYASNCSPERIDTQAEIKDFYGKAFDVIDAIDYIEALAFLELSPEEMSTLGAQVSYPNATGESLTGAAKENFPTGLADDEKSRYLAYQTTKYTKNVDPSVYQNLKTVYDLYDQKIMLYPGIYETASRGPGSYGGEGISIGRWYYPYNDYGLPDSYSLKWRAYQMLGYAGYDEGYIEYYSNIHPIDTPYTYYNNLETKALSTDKNYKTDLSALKIITHDDSMTYDKFQTDRFKEVEAKLSKLNSVINVEDYVQQFYEALKKDYHRQTVELDAFFDNITKNGHPYGAHSKEACLKDQWCMNGYAPYHWDGVANYINLDYSVSVRKEIYQKLKQLTNDFRTDEIYQDTNQQNFSSVDELRSHIKSRLAAAGASTTPENLVTSE